MRANPSSVATASGLSADWRRGDNYLDARRSPRMKLVGAAIDPQQAAAEPKDCISGCSRALTGGLGEKKVRLNCLSSHRAAGKGLAINFVGKVYKSRSASRQ
jgi:hypothetical protein